MYINSDLVNSNGCPRNGEAAYCFSPVRPCVSVYAKQLITFDVTR